MGLGVYNRPIGCTPDNVLGHVTAPKQPYIVANAQMKSAIHEIVGIVAGLVFQKIVHDYNLLHLLANIGVFIRAHGCVCVCVRARISLCATFLWASFQMMNKMFRFLYMDMSLPHQLPTGLG